MSFERREYTKREAHLAALASCSAAYAGPFDEAVFRRQYRRYDARQATSDATQLLLMFCQVNAGEAFGVEIMRPARAEYFDRPETRFQAEKVLRARLPERSRIPPSAFDLERLPTEIRERAFVA